MTMGLLGLFIFVADIWAILTILKSTVATDKKVLWCLLILLLPVLGLIIWYLAGPKN